MFEVSPNKKITGRVIRNTQPERRDDEWTDSSPEDRIEAVWTLTNLCFAWDQNFPRELRLQRLLLILNAHGVDYLIVGAHALAAYGHVRATKDLDLWVRPEPQNAEKVLAALSAFGAPVGDLTLEDLTREGTVFQIGVQPLRIDLITSIDGVNFAEAWPDRFSTSFGGVPVFVISRHHLITNKKAAARLQDLADVERLEATNASL
jgi:hypothetical protein